MRAKSVASKTFDLVYLVGSVLGGPVKIGASTTKSLRSRLLALQSGCPVPLRLLMVSRAGREKGIFSLEYKTHQLFRDLRLHGEWFDNSERLVDHFVELLAGSTNPGIPAEKIVYFRAACSARFHESVRPSIASVLLAKDPKDDGEQWASDMVRRSLERLADAADAAAADLERDPSLVLLCLPFTERGTEKADLPRTCLTPMRRAKAESSLRVFRHAQAMLLDRDPPVADVGSSEYLRRYLGLSSDEWAALMARMGTSTGYLPLDIDPEDHRSDLHDLNDLRDHLKGEEFMANRRARTAAKKAQDLAVMRKGSLGKFLR